jgi:hypothetical protein
MKLGLKNQCVLVRTMCCNHIKGCYKITLMVDKTDRVKQFFCYVFTS